MPVYVHYNKTHISSILVLPLDLKKKIQYSTQIQHTLEQRYEE